MGPPTILQKSRGAFHSWQPTTLADLGLGEEVLEAALASDVELLLPGSRGLHFQNSVCFRQVAMRTPGGRPLRVDLLILTDGGHAIVVEVKRFGNPELVKRDVLSQLVDYAASLSATSSEVLSGSLGYSSFLKLVVDRFPAHKDKENLAGTLSRRFRSGELLLIVACDMAPEGTVEWLRSAASQNSLAFDLCVLEVRPYVCRGESDSILFVPSIHSETTIVSRTAVVVRNEVGTERIIVNVQVESGDEIEENLAEVSAGVRKQGYPQSLKVVESALGLGPGSLEQELELFSTKALQEDWSFIREAVGWPDSQKPYLRWGRDGQQYVDGRLGLDLLSPWRPGLFVGVMVTPRDHRCGFSSETGEADFSLILSLAYNRGNGAQVFHPYCSDHRAFRNQPEYLQMLDRLRQDSGNFQFHDHADVVAKPNLWHPLHLRRPLSEVFAGASTAEQRYAQWLGASRQALDVLLRGGELQGLRERLMSEVGTRV